MEGIDLTLWGSYSETRLGFDERNDRRAYRLEYEESKFGSNGDRFSLHDAMLRHAFSTLGLDDAEIHIHAPILINPPELDEDDHIRAIGRFFPEDRRWRDFVFGESYGMCDPHFNRCDCCGVDIDFLNKSFKTTTLCVTCCQDLERTTPSRRSRNDRSEPSFIVREFEEELNGNPMGEEDDDLVELISNI